MTAEEAMAEWIQKTSMPSARHDLTAIGFGGSIYAISGSHDSTVDDVAIYDVATDRWTPGPAIPTARGWLGAALLDNVIYVAGGKTIRTPAQASASGIDYFIVRDALEAFDLRDQTWRELEPMRGVRAGLAVAACGGKIYAVGGNTMVWRDQQVVDRVEVYDPQSGHWEMGPSLPATIQGPAAASVDGLLYVAGGIDCSYSGSKIYRDELYVLDPDVGRWETLAPLPTGRESMGIAVLGRKIFTFGGKSFDGDSPDRPEYSTATEVYDIDADSWSVATPMPVGKAWMGTATVGGRLFTMGGANVRWTDRSPWIDDLHEFVP